jgi:hypothetical protein
MRRKLAAVAVVGVLAGGVVASSLTPAGATHTYRHLVRQINRLENQVAALRDEVYNCERLADYQVTDPTTAQPVTIRSSSTCANRLFPSGDRALSSSRYDGHSDETRLADPVYDGVNRRVRATESEFQVLAVSRITGG